MELKHSKEMEKIGAKMGEEIQKAIDKKIAELTAASSLTSPAQDQPVPSYASAASAAPPNVPIPPLAPAPDTEWFWKARRCLRFFPIAGTTENQMRTSLDAFFSEKLKIPTGVLSPSDVGFCLLYTSPSPRDLSTSRMPSSA